MFVEKAPSSPRWKTKVATFSRLFVLTDQLAVTVVVPRPGVSEPERMNSLGSFVKVADAVKSVDGPGTVAEAKAVGAEVSASTTA